MAPVLPVTKAAAPARPYATDCQGTAAAAMSPVSGVRGYCLDGTGRRLNATPVPSPLRGHCRARRKGRQWKRELRGAAARSEWHSEPPGSHRALKQVPPSGGAALSRGSPRGCLVHAESISVHEGVTCPSAFSAVGGRN
jgi:hypothetical protein